MNTPAYLARRTWTVLSLFILLVPLLSGPVASGQSQSPPLSDELSVLPPWFKSVPFSPPLTEPQGKGTWVVRAYYDDRQMVNDLAAWTEPWEVHHDKGYLVVGVDRAGYERLLDAGFRLEIDQRLTAQLNQPRVRLPGQITGIPGYPCYRTVEETFATAQNIVAAYPDLATWIDIGDTWEKTEPGGDPGYDMMVLRLTNSNVAGPKPKLFVMSSVHAREYTPAELNTRFAEYLVDNYGTDPDVTWLLDYHEIHLLLQANPDGRIIAEQGHSQRKNTNDSNSGSCADPPTPIDQYGTDPNRNFSFKWNCCGGSSGAPCNVTYRGPGAASEPETQAIQDYVRSQFPDQRADPITSTAPITATGVFVDIHSYGEYVLWPWGFTLDVAPNGAALQTLGRKFAYFNHYWPEQAIGLYLTDGTTGDFAYGDLGLAAYTFELGTEFFQDCSTFTNTILPDNLPALVYAAKVSRTPYVTPAGPDALDVTVAPGEVEQGSPVTLTAIISDTRYNNSNGVEPTQNITAAECYVDVPPWITTTTPISYPLAAMDGAFDATAEEVKAMIDTTGLSIGRHIVFVRGQDAAGNWGAFSAVFLGLITPTIAPTAEFTSNSPVELDGPITFTNLTTGTLPLDYRWDFGDELGVSTESEPSYTYASSGDFTVTLVATNSVGSDSTSHTVTVLPVACVSATITALEGDSPVELGEMTHLTATVSGDEPITYTWDFGDSTTPQSGAGLNTITHTYGAVDTFTVTLDVANSCPFTDTRIVTVTLNRPPLELTWNKLVYVNGTLTGALSVTVWASDTIQIADWVSVTSRANVAFTLVEAWSERLTLTGWISNTGEVITTSNTLTWTAENAAPHTWHGLTKTFEVAGGDWARTYVSETLWVQNADPQLSPRRLIFDQGDKCSPVEILDLQDDSPAEAGHAVHFAATVVGQTPITYTWNFGPEIQTGVGLNAITHTFGSPGAYTVTLAVSNTCPSSYQLSVPVSIITTSRYVYLPLVIK